eukprot:TRINITY_DN14996_c0_g1_i1.p1 TRINITY_DN14996_c0_g1~~TRINITY_DN14996_c0_g1_i1.p1  ORF type:complete len:989 (-),score=183.86 TRINITY_DN14996_c0_g1_i1:141-3107(-)
MGSRAASRAQSMAPCLLGLWAVILAIGFPCAQALFEDEVGQYEWHVEQVGEPSALEFSADASDVLVASASGVVASVSVKDGALQWRRVASEGGMKLLRAGGKFIVTATAQGLVQGWKRSNGDLAWQREYGNGFVDLLLAGGNAKQTAVVVRTDELDARSMIGKHEWSLAASAVGPNLQFDAAVQQDTALCAVMTGSGSSAKSARIELETGKVASTSDMSGDVVKALRSGSYMIVDSYMIVLDGTKLSAHPMCGDGKSASYDLKNAKASTALPFSLKPWQRTSGVFAIANAETTIIFGVNAKGLKNLRSFDGQAVVGPVLSDHEDEGGQPVAVALNKATGAQIQLLDPASGNVQPAIDVEGYTSADHGEAKLLVVQELSSGEHRTVLTSADHSMAGMRGSKIVWAREEALASIKHAAICGRGASTMGKGAKGGADVDTGGLPAWLADIVRGPMQMVASIQDIFTRLPAERKRSTVLNMMPNTKLPTSSDELKSFGANKLILAATSASKIFALEATTSEIVWTKYLPSEKSCTQSEDAIGCGLWMRLMPAHAGYKSELLVVAPQKGASSHRFIWMDPLTGSTLHEEDAPAGINVMSVSEVPRRPSGSTKVRPLLVIDTARRAYAMPADSGEAKQLLGSIGDRMFHYEVDTTASSVQGYSVGKLENPAQKLVPLWNLELGFVGEKIVASTSLLHREWENVPVYIKGDASILHKYINPNLLAVAAVDTQTKNNVSALSLYAMDSVTGHVLHQSRIVGGAGPVRLVACDNFIIMHYWNSKKVRFEVTVIELFEAKADDGPWNLLFGQGSANETKSAYSFEAPVPLQHTYIAPAGVTALGVTATQKGITPRSILMAMTTDHIFRVSKDQLNPRRPHANGNKDDVPAQFAPTKDEVLPPYAPVMPLRPTDVLTHYNAITRVNGIVSSPTDLESTSIVFCHGLDLFFTPVQTAKAYDVLSPGFNYKLLYVSVACVLGVFAVTTYIAQYRTLQERWK